MAIEPAKIKNLARDPDMASTKTTLENLRTAVNQLRTDADTLIAQASSLQAQADSLQSQIDAAVGDISILDGRVDDLENNPVVPGGNSGYVQFNDGGVFTAADTLYWDKTNKRLGINKTDPAYSIHISKTSANAILGLLRTDGCDCYVGAGANNMIFVNNTSGKGFSFTAYGTTRIMNMTSAGDVIIGPTGNPSFRLDVQGTCGISDLKTPASHPTNYKLVYVDTDTGKLYSHA